MRLPGHFRIPESLLTTNPRIRPQRRLFALLLTVPCGLLIAGPANVHGQAVLAMASDSLPEVSHSDKLSSASLPEAPSALLVPASAGLEGSSSSSPLLLGSDVDWVQGVQSQSGAVTDPKQKKKGDAEVEVDANGNPIPIDRQQPHRILGFMPNFRSVSGGAKAHPPGFKYNFKVATRQAFDYSSFLFLFLTSISAEGINQHPVFGKGIGGLYTYTWHGFLDKTDGTYLQAWLLPSILHEDTRYYAMGNKHGVAKRILYVISRQGVARTYGGHNTPTSPGWVAKC